MKPVSNGPVSWGVTEVRSAQGSAARPLKQVQAQILQSRVDKLKAAGGELYHRSIGAKWIVAQSNVGGLVNKNITGSNITG